MTGWQALFAPCVRASYRGLSSLNRLITTSYGSWMSWSIHERNPYAASDERSMSLSTMLATTFSDLVDKAVPFEWSGRVGRICPSEQSRMVSIIVFCTMDCRMPVRRAVRRVVVAVPAGTPSARLDIERWTSLLGHVTWSLEPRNPGNGPSCAKYRALRPVFRL